MAKTKVKETILVDIGNSETRYYALEKQDDMTYEDILKAPMHKESNVFANLIPTYKIPEDYINEKTYILKDEGLIWANGEIVSQEFAEQGIKPTALKSKASNKNTYLTLKMIMGKVLLSLAEDKGVSIKDLDVTFDMMILLPPVDGEETVDTLKETISTINTIQIVAPKEVEINIKLGEISTLPEGYTAFLKSMYDIYQDEDDEYYLEVRDDEVEDGITYEDLLQSKGDLLLIDIGAGTTDVMLFSDGGRLKQRSKYTFSKGGNTVGAIFKQNIKKKLGINVADEDTTLLLQDCVLKEGFKVKHYVEDCLNKAKQNYANELTHELQAYLESMSMEMRLLKGVLVTGGGSMPTYRDGELVSEAMGTFLADYIKEFSPNCLVIRPENPRYLNIEGLKWYYCKTNKIIG